MAFIILKVIEVFLSLWTEKKKKKNDHGENDLGNCQLTFGLEESVDCFRTKAKGEIPMVSTAVFHRVGVRQVEEEASLHFLLWVPGHWGAHLRQHPPCRLFLSLSSLDDGVGEVLDFWK